MRPESIAIPAPRTDDWHDLYLAAVAINADLVTRLEALIVEAGEHTYWGLQLAAALRGEDE
jgi:hypothetical protein